MSRQSLEVPISNPFVDHPTTAAINATATATVNEVATGWITSTSGAATTITQITRLLEVVVMLSRPRGCVAMVGPELAGKRLC